MKSRGESPQNVSRDDPAQSERFEETARIECGYDRVPIPARLVRAHKKTSG